MPMFKPLTHPHLPESKVSTVVCQPQAAVSLHTLGINVLSPAPHPDLPTETNLHPDMLFCHLGGALCVLSDGQTELKKALTAMGFNVIMSDGLKAGYPKDIGLNCLITENYVIGNLKYLDKQLLNTLPSADRKFLQVNQGYTKCNLCVVDEHSFITEDEGLYRQLTALRFDVLKISPGDIRLSDTHYGFLGGASGKISKNTLAIFGSLNYHRDKEKIIRFLYTHGVMPVYLRDEPVKDIGGILPLTDGE